MHPSLVLPSLAILMAACGPGGLPLGEGEPGARARPASGNLLVGLRSAGDRGALAADVQRLGGTVPVCFEAARVCVAHFEVGLPVQALRGRPYVRYVEVDRPMDRVPTAAPAIGPASWSLPDPSAECPDPWELEAIGLAQAWTLADDRGARAPVVAVADSGFLTSHVDLVGQVWGQYDYGNGDPVPEVEWGSGVPAHGTFIAGVVAGVDDGVGRVGVLPDGRLNLLKVADDSGALFFSYAIAALADLADGDLGVRVVNYSIASSSTTTAFTESIEALADVGIVMVAAAANCPVASCSDADNDANPLYPASLPFEHVVTVAGHLPDGDLNPYSHYGAWSVDLAAPGVDLCGPGVLSDADWYTSGGTSYAAPLVAGTAGLLMGAFPRLTPTEVARVLRASAIPTPGLQDLVRSDGRLSAEQALATAVPRLAPPVDRVLDRYGDWRLEVSSVGAQGTGWVVLTADPAVRILGLADAAPAGWTLTPFAPGDVLDLPDAVGHVAAGHGAVATGPMPHDDDLVLSVDVAGEGLGRFVVSARLVTEAPDGGWLNAPYDLGTDDETGFLAHRFVADVAAALPSPSLGLETGPLVPGQPLELTASGLAPGQTAWLVRGTVSGIGPCPAFSARCVHLADGAPVAPAVADAAGLATWDLPVPAGLPADAGLGFEVVVPSEDAWSPTVWVP